jgi:adenylosuccinate synthase
MSTVNEAIIEHLSLLEKMQSCFRKKLQLTTKKITMDSQSHILIKTHIKRTKQNDLQCTVNEIKTFVC